MEHRGQDRELGMATSLGFSQPNPETLDHQRYHHNHHLNLHHQQVQHKQVRDPNPNPDPVSVSVSIQAPIPVATSAPQPPLSPQIPVGSNTKPPPPPPLPIRYRECLKNHAASMGGHVVDGCGEFMPCGDDGTLEALKCAACECHRNFHRKEIRGDTQQTHISDCFHSYNQNKNGHRRTLIQSPPLLPPPPPPPQPPPPPPQPPYIHKFPNNNTSTSPISPVMMMAFGSGGSNGGGGGGGAAESSSEDLNASPLAQQYMLSKKRFRTKFSRDQKEKMVEFAEKLGWKIQKEEEQQVEDFCSDVGIKRQVFKVWMHNNKQAMKKKPTVS